MIELYLHKRPVQSVFNLMGENENDITYSIGWAFSRSITFLKRFLKTVIDESDEIDPANLVVSLQEHQKESGVTDIEIRGSGVHLIIEAKRGLWVPTEQQLRQYLGRFNPTAKKIAFVAMAECSKDYAFQHLPRQIEGVPVRYLSWREIGLLSNFSDGRHAEKRLMEELRNYLTTIVSMQKQDSNWVYVVSLGGNFLPNLPFIEIVEKRKQYFHPIGGKGWPKEPPNYLGFRYYGRLQSIHHVEDVQAIDNFHPHFPEAPDQDEGYSLFLYRLGAAIIPSKDVRTGNIFRNGRKWAMLDLLLTSETIAEASKKSYARMEEI